MAGLLLAALFPCAARAVPPRYFTVGNPHLEVAQGGIEVRLAIGVDNLTGFYEMLKDGASVELTANARLERVRSLWTNVLLAETEVASSLQHNPLTREFSLYMPGEEKPLLDKNLERLLAATWSKFGFPVAPLSLLDGEKGSEYRILVILRLQHAKPPPWLAKSFMLWSKEILDPEKITLDFHY